MKDTKDTKTSANLAAADGGRGRLKSLAHFVGFSFMLSMAFMVHTL